MKSRALNLSALIFALFSFAYFVWIYIDGPFKAVDIFTGRTTPFFIKSGYSPDAGYFINVKIANNFSWRHVYGFFSISSYILSIPVIFLLCVYLIKVWTELFFKNPFKWAFIGVVYVAIGFPMLSIASILAAALWPIVMPSFVYYIFQFAAIVISELNKRLEF